MKYPTFCLFALILLQKRVEPLQCYECDTDRDGIACDDPLDQTLIQLKTCKQPWSREQHGWDDDDRDVACLMRKDYLSSDSNMSRVIRSCSSPRTSCHYWSTAPPLYCTYCSTNGCNGNRRTEKEEECEKEKEKDNVSASNKATSLGLFIFTILQVIPLMM